MKRKVAIVFVFAGIYILGFLTYNYFNTDKAIFNRVINANGYTVQHIGQSDPLEFFVKPEWISLEKDVKLNVNEKVIESHNTTIVLDEVWNRGEKISFSFHLTFEMNQNEGDFLYNYTVKKSSIISSTSHKDIVLFDKKHKEIEKNGTSKGPETSFSFNINKENLDFIRDGFYVVYHGLQLHEYSKN